MSRRRPAGAQPSTPAAGADRPLPGVAAGRPTDGPVVTLGEGSTPLVEAGALSELLGCSVFVKVEGANPTGSFKDRGMTVAVSVSAAEGAKAVVCASTGNTSASAAAYASRAGMLPIVLLPAGRISTGKLAQAIVHGGKVVQVDGNFDDCLDLARRLADSYPVALVNSVNDNRLEGQKTAAFEVVDDLGDAPDLHVMPVGNAGNISAYWRGYTPVRRRRPRHPDPADVGLPGGRRGAAGARPPGAAARHRRQRHPDRQPRLGAPGPARRATTPAGSSSPSPTTRSSTPRRCWPAARASSSSPRPPRASPACSRSTPRASWTPGQQVVVTVTGHGLKDIDTALDPLDPAAGRGRRGRARAPWPRSAACAADARRERRCEPGRRVTVEVPATSANLGPGFDCFGLALSWREQVELTVTDGGFGVDVTGRAPTRVPRDESHLILRSTPARARRPRATRSPGLRLRCHGTIPHGRGLGSSSAAIVAGLLAARGLVHGPREETAATRRWTLQHAAAIEGHPDNVAAAVHGGFVLAWTGARRGRGRRQPGAPRRRARPVFVAVDAGGDQGRPRPAAPVGPAPRRRRATPAGPPCWCTRWPPTPTTCWPGPPTGCTRTSGGRRCRTRGR